MRSRYYLPSLASNANTGPKGVIADAQAFEHSKKSKRMSFLRSSRAPQGLHSAYPSNKEVKTDEEKTSDEDDGNEDGFMARWRSNRMRELQDAGRRFRSRTVSPRGRVFGTMTTVDGDGYLDAVEKTTDNAVVVVFIYDDLSEISNMVEVHLRKLAKRHATTRFVRLHYEEAEIEGAGVPAVLAYRKGDKFADLIPVTESIDDDEDLSPETLERAMQRKQIL